MGRRGSLSRFGCWLPGCVSLVRIPQADPYEWSPFLYAYVCIYLFIIAQQNWLDKWEDVYTPMPTAALFAIPQLGSLITPSYRRRGFLVAQMVKDLPVMQETRVQYLGQEVPLEEGMANHSSILAQRIPMDRGAWRATVHRVSKRRTWLKWLSTHAHLSQCDGLLNYTLP